MINKAPSCPLASSWYYFIFKDTTDPHPQAPTKPTKIQVQLALHILYQQFKQHGSKILGGKNSRKQSLSLLHSGNYLHRDGEDGGSIPGSERSPGGRHGNPLQYSYLRNPQDREAFQTMVQRIIRSQT